MNNIDFKFISLCLAFASLPSFEAPKTIFIIIFLISWLFIAYKNQNWGGRWRTIDTLFFSWLFVAILTSLNAILLNDFPAKGIKDIFRYILLGWVVSRCFFSNSQGVILSFVLILSTLFTLIEAYYQCPNGGTCLELNSVGHVNHTAIFLLLAYTLCLSLILSQYNNLKIALKIILIACMLIFGYAIIDSLSRAASGLLVIITFVILLWKMLIYKNKLLILFSTIILISGSLILFFSPPQIINKFQHGSSLTGDSARQKIRNFSYYAFKSNPVLGIGFGNFNKLALIDIKQAVVNDNKKFNANEYMPYSHAHNIFYTTLVEGGLCLFFIFLLFWCHIIQIIGYLTKQSETAMWLLWSATGVILINLGIGLVNTTLHHEHAIFSMFLLGLLISNYRKVLDLKKN